jgi:hypothetical protein
MAWQSLKLPKLKVALLALNAIGFAVESVKLMPGIIQAPGPVIPFMVGAVITGYHTYCRERGFGDTFEHEGAHFAMAKLMGGKTNRFLVSAQPVPSKNPGGLARMGEHSAHGVEKGTRERCWILGPYFFPYITLILLLLRLTLGNNVPWLFDCVVGVSFGYHVASHWKQIPNAVQVARKDPCKEHDFARYGVAFSFTFVVMAQLMIIPSILIVIHTGWFEAGRFLMAGQSFWLDLIFK